MKTAIFAIPLLVISSASFADESQLIIDAYNRVLMENRTRIEVAKDLMAACKKDLLSSIKFSDSSTCNLAFKYWGTPSMKMVITDFHSTGLKILESGVTGLIHDPKYIVYGFNLDAYDNLEQAIDDFKYNLVLRNID